MSNRFFALDVETANADTSTICQIGIVEFSNGAPERTWNKLINPGTYFDPYNISIHGVSPNDVKDSPSFSALFQEFTEILDGEIVLHHGHFDRTAFNRSYDVHSLPAIACSWLDNTKVVRRTWSEFSKKGYGPKNLTRHFNIPLDHHDALSDAKAAGQVFTRAVAKSGLSPTQWLDAVKTKVPLGGDWQDHRRDGDPEAPFFGENIVFTGAMDAERSTVADVAQGLGFDVQNNITQKTTFLIVGIQDPRALRGYSKSSKHRKAEAMAEEGYEISILVEEDFWAMARAHSTGEVP